MENYIPQSDMVKALQESGAEIVFVPMCKHPQTGELMPVFEAYRSKFQVIDYFELQDMITKK